MARIQLNDIPKIQDLQSNDLENMNGRGNSEITGTMGEIPDLKPVISSLELPRQSFLNNDESKYSFKTQMPFSEIKGPN